jgi:hypothetical protein
MPVYFVYGTLVTPISDRALILRGAALAAAGAVALLALGRFRPALALTLGAAVAIVCALWLSDVVTDLAAGVASAASFSWKFGLKAVFRWLVAGLALYGAVRWVPAEVPWLLAGTSAVVLSVMLQGLTEAGRRA